MKKSCVIGVFFLFLLSACEKMEDILGKGKDNEKDVETVFVADGRYVYALNPSNGSVKWDFNTGGGIFERLIVVEGTVYVDSDGDRVYAIDASTGNLKWSFNATNSESYYRHYSVVIGEGLVYINVQYEGLYALDMATGSVKWSFFEYNTRGGATYPLLSDESVYVSVGNKFYALDQMTGKVQWSFTENYSSPINAPVFFTTTVFEKTVFLASYDQYDYGQIYALDKVSGLRKWDVATGKEMGYMTISNGLLYVVGSDDHGYLYALDPFSGVQKWIFETVEPMIPSLAISGGNIYICSKDQYLYAIDTSSGSKKWSFKAYGIGGYSNSSPVIAGDFCYVAGTHNIFAVEKESGASKWTSKTSDTYGAVLVYDGVTYQGSRSFRAFEAQTGVLKWAFGDEKGSFGTPCLLLKNGEVVNAGKMGTIIR